MKLARTLRELEARRLPKRTLLACIRELRKVIRWHRDQKLDDRCWLDDFAVWSILSGLPAAPASAPPFDESMRKCRAFYMFRRANTADEPEEGEMVILRRRDWNADLRGQSTAQLVRTLYDLQSAINDHCEIHGRQRTIDDDRQLYRVLPEKVSADFRLPPEADFLGEARAPHAGCPSFWRSHAGCTRTCNLHRWGPCGKKK